MKDRPFNNRKRTKGRVRIQYAPKLKWQELVGFNWVDSSPPPNINVYNFLQFRRVQSGKFNAIAHNV